MHHSLIIPSSKPNGDHTYFLEVDLLETDCHVFDPTPIANCTVRPKALTVRLSNLEEFSCLSSRNPSKCKNSYEF